MSDLTLDDLADELARAKPGRAAIRVILNVAWSLGRDRAATEAESILADEPGKTIVEIPRLIRCLTPAPSRSERTEDTGGEARDEGLCPGCLHETGPTTTPGVRICSANGARVGTVYSCALFRSPAPAAPQTTPAPVGPILGRCVDIDGQSWHAPTDPPCKSCGHAPLAHGFTGQTTPALKDCARRDCDNWPMYHFRTSRCPPPCGTCGDAGYVRYLGRDNDEIVENCSDCAPRLSTEGAAAPGKEE